MGENRNLIITPKNITRTIPCEISTSIQGYKSFLIGAVLLFKEYTVARSYRAEENKHIIKIIKISMNKNVHETHVLTSSSSSRFLTASPSVVSMSTASNSSFLPANFASSFSTASWNSAALRMCSS